MSAWFAETPFDDWLAAIRGAADPNEHARLLFEAWAYARLDDHPDAGGGGIPWDRRVGRIFAELEDEVYWGVVEYEPRLRRLIRTEDPKLDALVEKIYRDVRRRVGPAQYLREVRDEMRKVAWPTRPEVVRYSIIVTATVVVYTAFIGGADYGLRYVAEWFYT